MSDKSNSSISDHLSSVDERLMSQADNDLASEKLHCYLLARQYAKGKRVLEVGCGNGQGSEWLAEYAKAVIGVDDYANTLKAPETWSSGNLEFRIMDDEVIPLADTSVDIVICFDGLATATDPEVLLAEIRRVLRVDGFLFASVAQGDRQKHFGMRPAAKRRLYTDQLEALLEKHFDQHLLLSQRWLYGSAIGDDALTTLRWEAPIQENASGCGDNALIALASDGELPVIENTWLPVPIEDSESVVRLQAKYDALHRRIIGYEKQLESLNEVQDHLAEKESEAHAWREQCQVWVREGALLHTRAYRPLWLAKQLWKRLCDLPVERRRIKHDRQRIAQSGYFAADWYLAQNPDVAAAGNDPLDHFVRHGGFEGRSPSPQFDALTHLRHHPELWQQHYNPLLHWLDQQEKSTATRTGIGSGGGENALFNQLFDEAVSRNSHYQEIDDRALNQATRIRAIALYLPQFHPIAENDRWWGKGFTEWTNVSKAVPQFLGHEQPRLPGELGFYDLRIPAVQERQVELAKMHGLEAFCFHYYWFSGRKRLLETPIDQYVANDNIDFPFCICWANENWTRRWDGKENDVLMEQRYDPQDDVEFIEDVAPLLRDRRYVRIDGKPLLIVYRVDILPDARRTAETWRQWCRDQGIGELHLVAAQSFNIGDPRPYGFDAAMEFPPHNTYANRIEEELDQLNPDYRGEVYDYADLVFKQLAKPRPDYVRYRTVFPAWDNEARKPGRGHVFHGSTPARYQQWLAGACREADRQPEDAKLVFINAWNEWAEGAYLEPDRRHGYAYLSATRKVLEQFPKASVGKEHQRPPELTDLAPRRHETAVILHLYHTDLWDEIHQSLSVLDGRYDLYVSVPDNADDEVETRIRQDVPEAKVVRLVNRGRDVAPFLTMLRAIRPLGYTQLLKIHSKKSLHRGDGDLWRREFLGKLLSNRAHVQRILAAFHEYPEIGMIGPAGHWLDYKRYWGDPDSPARTRDLLRRIGASEELDQLGFFAGSMFWCRPEAMDRLLEHFGLDDFEPEVGQTDGTLAHALERVFAGACQATGMRVTDTANPAAQQEPDFSEHYPFARTSPLLGHSGEVPVSLSTGTRAKRMVRRTLGGLKKHLNG